MDLVEINRNPCKFPPIIGTIFYIGALLCSHDDQDPKRYPGHAQKTASWVYLFVCFPFFLFEQQNSDTVAKCFGKLQPFPEGVVRR